ncbi:SDR family oxidoreductase [Desulfuromonas sp. AOP6]|uniref:NAD-dependent epimerase/dehydratase family protein n=1 Tax=Desulfuromonas sp. AOP6 TaxID=1566351 RepID=UPI0012898837|nr:SDR family oxidoreductase [Desulfuromonas sp. AOP6]BCA79484.1 NAD-dependent epimerase [Desulfuromonas sp. AOP6]
MRILITGNMGYVGPAVVGHLRRVFPSACLLGVDLGFFANCTMGCDLLPECRLDRQIFADVRSLPSELLQSVDTIVHLAAISNDPMSNKFEDVTYAINHQASVALARQAKAMGVKRFIFASSCSMYGAGHDNPRKESDALNPLTPYARSKVMTERDLEPLADEDFIVTSLRFSTACGMSDRLRLDLVLNDFVACAVTSKKISILSDGTPWRPLINTKDMARAIEWAVTRPSTLGGPFLAVNVGSEDRNYQVREVADLVANLIPGVSVEVNPAAPPDKRSYRVNFDLFRQLAPEHQPVYTLADSIQEVQQSLQSCRFNDLDFRSSRMMRLNHLNYLLEKGYLNEDLRWVAYA